ncbi:hypothetical protein KEM60_02616 [Austwickia sp. TVS 96-490-7B]|uniref:TIGR03085 family metal-binding protein n=1 Tax=Austwickia sp. TVS 96-490-7B TaxID=2830843 RepID=UPI001C5A184C|nr:TIGR03085 family metal-binding protein [Austwickia sp. TVS 96-490-7B]MBW3086398.1 hypothetical protein [Austwickia sp. TVS 96-490-7B]
MTGLAQIERAALCSTLTRLGPQAPTLCDGWTTRDLAAHLVMRERRPDAAAGVVIPALAGHTQRVQDDYATQSWAALVDMVRQGPRPWTPLRVPAVDDAINLAEFFVHHEDILRAQPEGTAEHPRELDADMSLALWSRLRQAGLLLFRAAPVGVRLHAEGYGTKQVKAATKDGDVALTGAPGELMLFAFGRGKHTRVDLDGPPEAVQALQNASLGA